MTTIEKPNGLLYDCSDQKALEMGLLQSYTKPLISPVY